MSEVRDELDPPFEIVEPVSYGGPIVFNSPHSGSVYPRAFLGAARLDLATLRRSEDTFVDELILGVVARGGFHDGGFHPTGICGAFAAALVAGKVLNALSQPFVIEGRSLTISASIGIGVYPGDGESFTAVH